MNAARLPSRIVSAFILILLGTLPACAPTAVPTLFRPPGGSASPSTPRADLGPGATTPVIFPANTPAPIQITAAPPCENNLTWLSDLNYPDNSFVLPSQAIDKQWLVQNTGTCDWDARYRLRFVGGRTLGAVQEIPLYPARTGARIALRVLFTAPAEAGNYESQWQAVSPDGTLFGDAVFIQITVAP